VRRMLGLCVVALLACAAPAAAAPTGPLSQNGRWITDAKGRVAIMHGVNMVSKRPPYAPATTGFDEDDARFLRREGFDTVRLGVIYAGVEPQPGRYSQAYLDQIQATADALAKADVFYQLDFHQDLYNERFEGEGWPDWAVQDDGLPAAPKTGFPNNYLLMPALSRAFDHFWANDPGPGGVGLQDRYAEAWRQVATRFRGKPHNMGYDLLNEPWPGTGWQACANTEGCPVFDREKLTPFSQRVYNQIRRADPRGIVWYEPNVIFNNGPKSHHGAIGPKTGLSFHVYCLAGGATAPADPTEAAPREARCDTLERLPFTSAEDQARRTDSTLLLSEFGATDDLDQIQRVVRNAEESMMSWQYWHYCPCADPTTTGSGSAQALVLDPAKPPTGDNVVAKKLAVLSRAYPQAVAGTPERYRFDAQRKRFDMAYSTARVGGGGFARRADTQVFVPSRHFTRGYDVTVSGGEAISKPSSPHLVVRNCTGRPKVTIAVAAGTGARRADCRAPRYGPARFKLKVSPRRVRAGRRVRLRVRATEGRTPVRGVRVRFGRHLVRTDRRGRATIRTRVRRPGRYKVRARKAGYRRVVVRVRALRRR